MRLMTINDITIFNDKKIIFNQKNIRNIVHQKGEQYMLNALFRQGERVSSYWVGLDNRTTLSSVDIMLDVSGEPFPTTSYRRQEVVSWEEPTLANNIYIVKSSPIQFSATSSGWGPVSNIFLSTKNSGGILISSAKLSQPISLVAGNSVIMTISLSLTN